MEPEQIRAYAQEAGRYYQSLRERGTRTCGNCGKEFVAVKQARYCSGKCRIAALRKRRTAGGGEVG